LVAEAVPQLLWVTDADGRVEYVNQRFIEYSGTPSEDLLGDTAWRTVLHPDDLERCLAAWNTAMAAETVYETEYRLRRASDSMWRWHLARAMPVRDAEGRVEKWFGTSTDIEDQKQVQASLRLTEERALQESKRKDEFLAMLGHELRNPLAPILGAVHILKRDVVARELDIIERQARHMARLVDDLLDVSRISRGRIELRLERCQIGAAIQQAVDANMPLIDERGLVLVVDVAPEALDVHADPARITQVIANVLNNAAKFSETGGVVTVSARRDGDEIVVSVKDTGIGIPEADLPHVFDLFVQGERSLDRSQGGLGIGLTLVRKLVQMHNGSAIAKSRGTGTGTEIVVRLPAATPASLAPTAEVSVGPRELGRRKVLVVDDNEDITMLLADFLTWKGFEVEIATTGIGALGAALAIVPDVVLLDIGLPTMTGYEVARHIRADARLVATRLIALSGYGQDSDRERSLDAGFEEHLTKPIDFEHLARLLHVPLRRRAQNRPDGVTVAS
jgi:PAS domain S-box-containing protein